MGIVVGLTFSVLLEILVMHHGYAISFIWSCCHYLGKCSTQLAELVPLVSLVFSVLAGLILFMLKLGKNSCFSWKWPFFDKKHHTKFKKIHNSAKTYDNLVKWKDSESWWFAFVISAKKYVFHFGRGPCWPLFNAKLGPQKAIFRGFTKFFSELLDCNRSY